MSVHSLPLLGVALLLIGLFVSLLAAPPAEAKDNYVGAGTIPGVAVSQPRKIAVDDATGNVLVVDAGHNQVQVWGPGGVPASTQLLSFGADVGLSSPYGIAVDQANGDVYVSNTGRDEIQSFSVTGADGGTYTLTFDGQTTAPIAFDADAATIQAALEALSNIAPGDVTVDAFSGSGVITFGGAYARTDVPQVSIDGSGLNEDPLAGGISATTGMVQIAGVDEIVKFAPDDRDNPTAYTPDPSFTSPAPGSAPGQIGDFASALTVDPATGDLLVADVGNKRVSRYSATGTFLSSFDGSTSAGGPFQFLQDIVVGGGVVYVLDATEPYNFGGNQMEGVSRVEKFDSAGNSLGALPNDFGMSKARDLAYGAASGSVFVGEQVGSLPSKLHVYRNDVQYQVVELDPANAYSTQYTSLEGIAVDDGGPGSSGRVYASLGFSGLPALIEAVYVFDRQRLPEVTIDAPSSIEPTSAHLTGSFDPVLGTATAQFEYSADGGQSWSPITTTDDTATAPAIGEPEADLTGLAPSSAYQVRLTASNAEGQTTSAPETFKTAAAPPLAVTGAATERTESGATLRGSVTPLGAPTTYHFEYGPTAFYGSRAPAGERSAGSGQGSQAVAQIVAGLQPATTYHFRIVAHNIAGDAFGADQTFTTLAPGAGSPSRAFELVSPADKGGAHVKNQIGVQASADGNAIAYTGSTSLGGFPDGGTAYPHYVAQRSSDGWTSKALDPPPGRIIQDVGPIHTTVGISDDGTKAVVLSSRKLAPGAVEEAGNVYLFDVPTGAYTTMATTPDITWFEQEISLRATVYVQGTANFDHVLLLAPDTSFLPGVPEGALYEFTDGKLEVVSVDPDGNPIQGSGVGNKDHGRNVLSADGSRLIFSSGDAVYIREDGTTRPMSESQRAADPPGTLRPAALIGGDRDLKHVYFFSKDLTDDSPPGLFSLYRYDADTDTLQLLTKVSDDPGGFDIRYLQVSQNGTSVYFTSLAALTPGAPPAGLKLYVWHEGAPELAATMDVDTELHFWWASANGRYFAFKSASNLTGDAPPCSGPLSICGQVYRYDVATENLTCASCPIDGRPVSTGVYIGELFVDVGTHAFARAVSNTGTVFFQSNEGLVEKDTNGTWDVYEFDGEQQRLISTGTGDASYLADVSEDGRDVFFSTTNRLVAVDTDNSTDLYDARVGGGIAGQNQIPPTTACSGPNCGSEAALAPPPPGGSEGTRGRGNSSGRHKQRCGKGRKLRKVKGKQRCVKQHKNQSRANSNRRQGR